VSLGVACDVATFEASASSLTAFTALPVPASSGQ
jgi:hypothetical protein